MFNETELVVWHRSRAHIISNLMIMAFGIILARLWYLQIYKGNLFYEYSQRNRLRQEVIQAPRGLIYDRNGNLLVYNVPRFDVSLTPQYFQKNAQTFSLLSNILKTPAEAIELKLDRSRQAAYKPVPIKKNITFDEVALLETENANLPGTEVDLFISREYKLKEVGAHLLGYISEITENQLPLLRSRDGLNYSSGDYIGQAGLEKEQDVYVRGKNGAEFVEVDARGRKRKYVNSENLFKPIENEQPIPGYDLHLTVDANLQKIAYETLEGRPGSIVMVDVHSGEILTMVSSPSYDPSNFSRGITSDYWTGLITNRDKPLRDRVIQDHFSPGSTFKPVTAIAGLEEGFIDEKTTVTCNGQYQFGERVFHCWNKNGHGLVNIRKAIRESCNIFFYKLAARMDVDFISKYATLLGLGTRTGISLPREASGFIPNKQWKKKRDGGDWRVGETLSCAIGQSYVLTTALQLAMAYSVIANGGKLFKPFVVKKIQTNTGFTIAENHSSLVRTAELNPETLRLVREGLYDVVNTPTGTAHRVGGQGLGLSGKTGTVQIISSTERTYDMKCENKEYRFRNHGIFSGFAPAPNPKVAIVVILEHGCSGASAALLAAKVLTEYMKNYEPDTYKFNLKNESKKDFNIGANISYDGVD